MTSEENEHKDEQHHKGHKISHVNRTHKSNKEPDFWKIAAFSFAILLILSIGTKGFTSFELFQGVSPTPQQGTANDIDIPGTYILGDENAPVTIIEFSDYMCPFCQKFHVETLPLIKQNYIDQGKVRFIFVDYPAIRHPVTEPAANAAKCAGEQGKYYDYVDMIFDNFNTLRGVTGDPTPQLLSYGEELDLNMNQFRSCVETNKYLDEVRENALEGSRRGVEATPTFFVNGVLVRGAQPYNIFEQYIEQALSGDLPAPTEPTQPTEPQQPPAQQIPTTPEVIDFVVEGQMLGDESAEISISEFSSYQCPFCQRFHQQTFPTLRSDYIDTGIVRMYARDFPLSTQVNSAPAANAAHCAGDQNAYFDYQKVLYERQSTWASVSNPTDTFVGYAEGLGLDEEEFRNCVEAGTYDSRVQSDFIIGQTVGVSGTPSFIILAPEDNVDVDTLVELQMPDGRGGFFIRYVETDDGLAGARVVGAQPTEVFEAVIAALR